MLNNKENYLRLIAGEIPESIPYFDFMGITGPSVLNKDRTPEGGFDCFGVEYVFTPEAGGGALPVPGKFMFTDIFDWPKYVKIPDLSGVDWEAMAAADTERFDRSKDLIVGAYISGFFQLVTNFMGFTEGLCAMAEEPEEVKALLEHVMGFYLDVGAKVVEHYKPELMWMPDDICTQISPFVSLDTFHDVFKPYWKRFVDFFKGYGIPTQLHCCGNAMLFVDDFVDCGYVAWDPLQTSNDIPKIKAAHPGRPALVGGFEMGGIPGITAETSEEEVRAKVREIIDSYAVGGQYAFFGNQEFYRVPTEGLEGIALRNAWVADERANYGAGYYAK